MKAGLACLLSLFLSAIAAATNNVQITEVGLKGYYSVTFVTPVQVQVAVPEQVQSIQLDFTVTTGSPDTPYEPWREDRFSQRLSVEPGRKVLIDLPLLLASSKHSKLDLTVSDSSGQKIGTSSIDLGSLTVLGSETAIAILCEEHTQCDEAQSQISFGGSEDEVADKNKKLKFIALQSPREHWWDYSAPEYVVVADRISGWTPDQRLALELYLRAGGNLVLLEKNLGDTSFLAAYRQGEAKADPLRVGRGLLFRLSSLQSKALSSMFTGNLLKQLGNGSRPYGASPMDWLRRRVAVSFSFPRLRWLLIWLAVYVLVVGLVNFALLRKVRRLEWGWVTTASIALIFAVGFYLAGSANRPKQMTLDTISLYLMDPRSPIAVENTGLRVSTPERRLVTVSTADRAVLGVNAPFSSNGTNVEIATEITEARRLQLGWQARLGPPLEVDLSLLRWSFADLDLQSFRTFPGSVTLSQGMILKNDTGQKFSQAVYLDFPDNLKYPISKLAPGEEINLTGVTPEVIWKKQEDGPPLPLPPNQYYQYARGHDGGPFGLQDLVYLGYVSGSHSHVFVGASDEPVSVTDLSAPGFIRKNLAVTVVLLDQP